MCYIEGAPQAHEKQSVGRAELDGVLTAIENKRSGLWLHIVKDSETLHAKTVCAIRGWQGGGGTHVLERQYTVGGGGVPPPGPPPPPPPRPPSPPPPPLLMCD